jgi:hypothetical protein
MLDNVNNSELLFSEINNKKSDKKDFILSNMRMSICEM